MVTPTPPSREQIAQVAFEAGFISSPKASSETDAKILNSNSNSFEFVAPGPYADENIRPDSPEMAKVAVAKEMDRAIHASGEKRDSIIQDIRDHYLPDLFL